MTELIAVASYSLASIVPLLLTLVVIGVVLWLIETKIPMDDTVKVVIRVIVVVVACLWLLKWASLI